MPDPIVFTATSPRHGLPLLFAGQSQREVFVNEALALADALLHPAVEGEVNDPPATPVEGETWLVAGAPTGVWEGHARALACFQAGNWIFAGPCDGMSVLDRSTGARVHYRGGWQRPVTPAEPTGGTTVDAEARTAIAGLIAALVTGGFLAES